MSQQKGEFEPELGMIQYDYYDDDGCIPWIDYVNEQVIADGADYLKRLKNGTYVSVPEKGSFLNP